MPTFSIITATYNRPELLQRMIELVLEQTFSNWQLVITDDSTNDDTFELIQNYKSEKRIVYLKNDTNHGLPYSRNRSMDNASGEWITFLDDDDLYVDKYALQRVSKILETETATWIAFATISPNGEIRTKVKTDKPEYNWLTDYLLKRNISGDNMPFIKKETVGNTRYRGTHRAEWYFWYDLSKKANLIYKPIPVVEVEYLPDGMSNLNYLKKERTYHGQQFVEMCKYPKCWKYLPLIVARYVASYSFIRKSRTNLKRLLRG